MQKTPSEGFSSGRLLDTALSAMGSGSKSVVDSTSGVFRLRRLLPLLAALAMPASALAQSPAVPQGSGQGAAELQLAQDEVSELQGTLEKEWDAAMLSAASHYAPEAMTFVRQMELVAGDVPSAPNGDPVWTRFFSPMLEKMNREGGQEQQIKILRDTFVQESLKSLLSIYQKEFPRLHSAVVDYVRDPSSTYEFNMKQAFRSVRNLEAQIGELQNFEQSFDSSTGDSTEKESSQTRYQLDVQTGMKSLPQSWMAQFEYLNATFDRYQGLLNQKDLSSADRDDLQKACFLIIGALANLGEPNFSPEAQNVKPGSVSSLKDTSMDGRDGPAPILKGDTRPFHPLPEVQSTQQKPEKPIDLKYYEAFERQFTAVFLAQFDVEWQAYVEMYQNAQSKGKHLSEPFDYRAAFEKALRVAQENMSHFQDRNDVLDIKETEWTGERLRYYFGSTTYVAPGALEYALTNQEFWVEAPDVLDGRSNSRVKRVMLRKNRIDDWLQGRLSIDFGFTGCENSSGITLSLPYDQLCDGMNNMFTLSVIEPFPLIGDKQGGVRENDKGELEYGPVQNYTSNIMGSVFDGPSEAAARMINTFGSGDSYHGEKGRDAFFEKIARLAVADDMRKQLGQ